MYQSPRGWMLDNKGYSSCHEGDRSQRILPELEFSGTEPRDAKHRQTKSGL